MNRKLGVFLVLMACAFSAKALEVKEGLVKLVVDERVARVSLYRLVDVKKGIYEPLFFASDPRTSYASLSIDGVQYRLGDSSDYRFAVSRTASGAAIQFSSKFCTLVESIDFVKSEGAALVDGVKISFALQNSSQKDESIGLRLLLDTWLGEKSGLHFRTSRLAKVTGETAIEGFGDESWISTPGERANLQIMLKATGLESPDRALLANWKRLSDASWSFEALPSRGFTLLPYSVNDSAVALFWEPRVVRAGARRTFSVIAGAFNASGYSDRIVESGGGGPAGLFSLPSAEGIDRETAMQADLVAVRDLLSRIDQALADGQTPSPEDIETWNKILDQLEKRKKGY